MQARMECECLCGTCCMLALPGSHYVNMYLSLETPIKRAAWVNRRAEVPYYLSDTSDARVCACGCFGSSAWSSALFIFSH